MKDNKIPHRFQIEHFPIDLLVSKKSRKEILKIKKNLLRIKIAPLLRKLIDK